MEGEGKRACVSLHARLLWDRVKTTLTHVISYVLLRAEDEPSSRLYESLIQMLLRKQL